MNIEKLKEDIERCRNLKKKGWDSYDAEPIPEATIELALKLVDVLPNGYNWRVGPTPDGEIQFETYEKPWAIICCVALE